MRQIQIEDHVFRVAQQRAAAAGYVSVEAYINHVVAHDAEDEDNFDHLFTPEVLADLDRFSAEVRAGAKTYTPGELGAFLKQKRDQWHAQNAT